jgi:SAM-dependent methyltransferase
MADAYERWLGSGVFTPFAREMARRSAARHPRRVLELAAGTGALTRELVASLADARIIATDLSPAMVDLGRANAPGADWRQADAMALPFDDAEFDLVTCAFGVMFLPDKQAGFAEAARVLDADGSLSFSVWGLLEEHDFQAGVVAGVRLAFPDDPPTFLEAVPHAYADRDLITADLDAAGLEATTVETITLPCRGESALGVAIGYCHGTPLRSQIEERGSLDDATDVVAAELTRRLGDGPVSGYMAAVLVEARPR